MFGEFNGLPIHALVLHAAVVFAPLAAIVGIGLFVPKWRRFLRWPFVGLAALALVSVYVAKESGEALRTALGSQLVGTAAGDLITTHADLAQKLLIAVAVLFVLSVVAAFLLPKASARWVGVALATCVTVVSVVVVVLTVQTGEAGAKAVWNPVGSVDYSAS